ncbi:poly(U)-specific endoribonuclease homolog [Fopius arisanus]|uniref:Poly(U)-specific endoribonuclease homolog n=1 Tax=Fopius arisanus TaxID=64838 RepID=A0A9R1TBP8_9HYME|nr:PREDICTED: poly(U)-specific endoribonuclease homolog [Fopius arisanus]
MKVAVLVAVLIIALCSIHVSDAKYRGGGSRGGSRGGSSGSSRGGSRGGSSGSSRGGSRGGGSGSSRPSPPIYHPPVHIPSPPVYKPPTHSAPPVHKPPVPDYKPFPPVPPPIHHPQTNIPSPHGSGSKPSAPLPGTINSKDSSSIFINNERPGSSYPDWANPGTKPSAPNGRPTGSHPPFPNTNSYPPVPNPGTKPFPPIGSPTGSHPPFPNTNSYPSVPNSKPYPDWANPGMKPGQPIGTPGAGNPSYPNTNPHRPYPPVVTHGGNTHARNSSFPSVSAPHPPKPSLPYPSSNPHNMPQPNAPHIGFNPGVTSGVGTPHINPPHNSAPLGAPPHLQPHSPPYPGHYGGYPGGYHVGQPGMVHNPYPMQPPPGMPNYGASHIYGGSAMSQPYVPSQTIIFPSQSSASPGIGQLVKEALVYSTINAGVNRLINGAPYHHHYVGSSPQTHPTGVSTVTNNTTIIYNNYGDQGQVPPGTSPGVPGAYVPNNPGSYPSGSPGGSFGSGNSGSYTPNGGTYGTNHVGSIPPQSPVPGAVSPPVTGGNPLYPGVVGNPVIPAAAGNTSVLNSHNTTTGNNQNAAAAPEAPPVPQYYISDDELMKLTETLFSKEEVNLKKYVSLYVQRKTSAVNVTDEAPGPLMYTLPELNDIPTVRMVKNMFDKYQMNSTLKENCTSEIRKEESLLLDTFLNTDVMTTAMTWLASKYYIEPDDFERKETLRQIWFNKIDGATSGFERIFLAELYPGPSFIGAQNWIYFAAKETSNQINYMGYTEERTIGDKASLLKINFKMGDAVKPNVTMLVGTSPELEMALYTVCFYARPNDICPVSLGGTHFYLYTHSFRYFGKDLIDVGIVAF